MEEGSEVYLNQTHPQDMQVIEQLTAPKHWDYERFRKVIIGLGVVGKGQSIPAYNRPDSIHIQGWRKHIDDLGDRTLANGREHARAIFVDSERMGIVFSGKITVGNEFSVRLDRTKESGREKVQRIIGSIHTHPVDFSLMSHGLSGADYRSFMGDRDQQIMVITYDKTNIIMVMKTSSTPNNLEGTSIDRRITDNEQDYLRQTQALPFLAVVNFNKAICADFGLTMYTSNAQTRDLMTRVDVTR